MVPISPGGDAPLSTASRRGSSPPGTANGVVAQWECSALAARRLRVRVPPIPPWGRISNGKMPGPHPGDGGSIPPGSTTPTQLLWRSTRPVRERVEFESRRWLHSGFCRMVIRSPLKREMRVRSLHPGPRVGSQVAKARSCNLRTVGSIPSRRSTSPSPDWMGTGPLNRPPQVRVLPGTPRFRDGKSTRRSERRWPGSSPGGITNGRASTTGVVAGLSNRRFGFDPRRGHHRCRRQLWRVRCDGCPRRSRKAGSRIIPSGFES